MTHIRNVFSVTRWVLALMVAYGCIHVAAGTLTRVVLDFEQLTGLEHATPVLALIGLANLFAAFGLVARSRPLQVISAVVLLMSSLAPLAAIPSVGVSGGFVVAAAAFALLVQVPIEALASVGSSARAWSSDATMTTP